MAFPLKYRKRWRSTNMQERLNQEVRRRERVVRIFPNDDAAFRLIGAVLADMNEAWMERRYLDMTEFYEAICSEDFSKTEKASAWFFKPCLLVEPEGNLQQILDLTHKYDNDKAEQVLEIVMERIQSLGASCSRLIAR